MKICFILLSLVFWVSFVVASEEELIYQVGEAFDSYHSRASDYLINRKLWIQKENQHNELQAVMPFELIPDKQLCADEPKIGVLLSHGLSDSPWSMVDSAQALLSKCYYVRVILLPGHGTRAEDLLDVSREEWRHSFRNAADTFGDELDALFVGGFSTGGTLAIEYAWKNKSKVSGVILLSPLFKINSDMAWLSPWLALVKDWIDYYPADDFGKYPSIPVPAMAQSYKLAKEVNRLVLESPNDSLPVFVALSEEDATVDVKATHDAYEKSMTSPISQMVLYSQTQQDHQIDRTTVRNSYWPNQRILGLSHMAIHGNPKNPYYGEGGEHPVCGWHLPDQQLYEECRIETNNWFGEYSAELFTKSPHAARISWNPDFDNLMGYVDIFIKKAVSR